MPLFNLTCLRLLQNKMLANRTAFDRAIQQYLYPLKISFSQKTRLGELGEN